MHSVHLCPGKGDAPAPPFTPSRNSGDTATAMNTKRTKSIRIRVTDEEHEQLRRRKQQPRLAAWMREHCLAADVAPVHQVARIEPSLLRQLAGIGNNINQIARRVNSSDWTTLDQVKVLAHLVAIERETARLKIEAARDR